MSQPAKAQEPSMEEILASIRRIISDDEAKPAAAAPVPAASAPAPAASPPTPEAAPKAPAPKAASPALRSAGKPATTGVPPSQAVAAKAAATASPAAAPAPVPEKNSQDDIDAMLASFDAPEPVEVAAPDSDDADDVFELTEQMAVPSPASKSFQKIEPHDDLEFSEPPAPPVVPVQARPVYQAQPDVPVQPVLTGATATAVESAFNALASTVLSNNARTLEDLVKEMLRPMLKSWLDDNLPTMVERIVKAEIERVARGR